MGVRTILGLTATATNATIDSIIRHFAIEDGIGGVIRDKPVPDNICLSVSKDPERDRALLGLLTSERFVNCESIIGRLRFNLRWTVMLWVCFCFQFIVREGTSVRG